MITEKIFTWKYQKHAITAVLNGKHALVFVSYCLEKTVGKPSVTLYCPLLPFIDQEFFWSVGYEFYFELEIILVCRQIREKIDVIAQNQELFRKKMFHQKIFVFKQVETQYNKESLQDKGYDAKLHNQRFK